MGTPFSGRATEAGVPNWSRRDCRTVAAAASRLVDRRSTGALRTGSHGRANSDDLYNNNQPSKKRTLRLEWLMMAPGVRHIENGQEQRTTDSDGKCVAIEMTTRREQAR